MTVMVAAAEEGLYASTDGVVDVINPSGAADIVLICEHASNFVPPQYDKLGLRDAALQSHIAWDPGALAVAQQLSRRLDAPLVAQRISRLIYDCNRAPDASGAVPEASETTHIPGNANLSPAARRAREVAVYAPFKVAIDGCVDRRIARGQPPTIVTVHSFAPVYHGVRRDVEIGVVYDVDSRFADLFLTIARTQSEMAIRRNEPYGPADGVTHTLAAHALPRQLFNVMIEIRNDLIADTASQQAIAGQLSRWLETACAAMGVRETETRHVG